MTIDTFAITQRGWSLNPIAMKLGRLDNALPGVPVDVTIASHPTGSSTDGCCTDYRAKHWKDPDFPEKELRRLQKEWSPVERRVWETLTPGKPGREKTIAGEVLLLIEERESFMSEATQLRLELDHAHQVLDGLGQPRTGPDVAGPSLLGTRIIRYSKGVEAGFEAKVAELERMDDWVGELKGDLGIVKGELATCRRERDSARIKASVEETYTCAWRGRYEKERELTVAMRQELELAAAMREELEAANQRVKVLQEQLYNGHSHGCSAGHILRDVVVELGIAGVPDAPTPCERVAMLAGSREEWKRAANEEVRRVNTARKASDELNQHLTTAKRELETSRAVTTTLAKENEHLRAQAKKDRAQLEWCLERFREYARMLDPLTSDPPAGDTLVQTIWRSSRPKPSTVA